MSSSTALTALTGPPLLVLCRLQVAFDNVRQVQIMSFLVQRPRGAVDYTEVSKRSVA